MKIFISKLFQIMFICINPTVKITMDSNVSPKLYQKSFRKIRNVEIRGAKIESTVRISDNVKLLGKCVISGNVDIGKFTSINGPSTRISGNINGVKIGNFCSIASNVIIQEDYHRYDKISTYFMNRNIFNNNYEKDICSKGKIVIEDDVWIGSNTVVLSGVKIGRGTVIGAGSVVTKDIPPYSIVVGNPAKVIKKRFNQEVIEKLDNSKWWTWDLEKIKENEEYFNKSLIN